MRSSLRAEQAVSTDFHTIQSITDAIPPVESNRRICGNNGGSYLIRVSCRTSSMVVALTFAPGQHRESTLHVSRSSEFVHSVLPSQLFLCSSADHAYGYQVIRSLCGCFHATSTEFQWRLISCTRLIAYSVFTRLWSAGYLNSKEIGRLHEQGSGTCSRASLLSFKSKSTCSGCREI